MYQPLERLLDQLAQRPIDAVYTTSHSGSGGVISRSQANHVRTGLQAPFTIMICQFNRDGTEQIWRAQQQRLETLLYHGYLPYHTQTGLCFQYVLRGNISKMLMGHPVRLAEGEACLIDMNCVHAELADTSDAILFSMELRQDVFLPDMYASDSVIDQFISDSIQERNRLNRYLIMRDIAQPAQIQEKIDMLLTFELTPGPGQLYINRGLVQQLFWLLSSQSQPELHSSASSPRQDIVFFELDRYCRAHLDTVDIRELTTSFHYDRNYFNRLIRKKTGLTYTQYLHRLRLEEAKRLLVQTGASVQEICQRIGYENRSFFYRIFQEHTGLQPLEYRRQFAASPSV